MNTVCAAVARKAVSMPDEDPFRKQGSSRTTRRLRGPIRVYWDILGSIWALLGSLQSDDFGTFSEWRRSKPLQDWRSSLRIEELANTLSMFRKLSTLFGVSAPSHSWRESARG